MADPQTLSEDEFFRLLRDVQACIGCGVAVMTAAGAIVDQHGAAVLDDDGTVHRGDLVTGRLLCGGNGDRSRWLVKANPRALPH